MNSKILRCIKCFLFLFFFFFSLNTGNIYASTIKVVDFYDDFSSWDDWNTYRSGNVERTTEQNKFGRYSLKKTTGNDPHGGYKELDESVGLGVTFEAWIYRPSDSTGGAADRLALSDEDFNGYGPRMTASAIHIERRDEGSPTSLASTSWTRTANEWYRIVLKIDLNNDLNLSVYRENGDLAGSVSANDTSYDSFDRVVVHGGYHYYVDGITVYSFEPACRGTPLPCGGFNEGLCNTCGCDWNLGFCSNDGVCSDCNTEAICNACACAGCSWGGYSCPWVGSWDGTDWVLEHEAFPFAAFKGVRETTYDSLPNLRCEKGTAKIQIYEGLEEITFLEDFRTFKVSEIEGKLKPDIYGTPRIINLENKIKPKACSTSIDITEEKCLEKVNHLDQRFFEPDFDKDKTEDWIVLNFGEISSENPKLYFVARKQSLLTSFYGYMAHILGEKGFRQFSHISSYPYIREAITEWWEENLKMQIELWDGDKWINQGRVSAGYHMPGSGADDFLISLDNSKNKSDSLKIRLKFITGGFGIDYIFLDDAEDPEFEKEEVFPKEILFNGEKVDYITPREMVKEDAIILEYDCDNKEQFYFSISGYYIPEIFPEERRKNPLCAWSEYYKFFTRGKEHVVEEAYKKGLFRDANNLDVFTQDEIKAQRECVVINILWGTLILFAIILLIFVHKRSSRKTFILTIFFIAIIAWIQLVVITTYGTGSCSGTLNCTNCLESNCISCTQCLWTGPSCSGTPDDCNEYTDEADCQDCGCDWVEPAISISIVDGNVDYGLMVVNSSKSTVELDDVQTVTNNSNITTSLLIKGEDSACWDLDAENPGIEEYVHQYCDDTHNDCEDLDFFDNLDTDYIDFKRGFMPDDEIDFHLRLLTPTSTSCIGQPQLLDVSILAVEF